MLENRVKYSYITPLMYRIFFRFYFDVTRYNAIFCIVYFLVMKNMLEAFLIFGIFGNVGAFLIYKYFQDVEYYFYLNWGLSKRFLIIKTFSINLMLSIIIIAVLWRIS